jgi:hypothetical protein
LKPELREVASTARTLAVEISAFLVAQRPPDLPRDPSENESHAVAYEKFKTDTVSAFGKAFGGKLLRLVQHMKSLELADVALNQEIHFIDLGVGPGIPERLNFIADHLMNADEMAILKTPMQRRLTPRQKARFRVVLAGSVESALIGCASDDEDAHAFARDFSTEFRKAGWKVIEEGPVRDDEFLGGTVLNDGNYMGSQIQLQRHSYAIDERLMAAFKEIGVNPAVYVADKPSAKNTGVRVLVGHTPPLY